MNTDFSSFELQFIRSSLTTKTDEEIAELLERPVDQVRNVINDITGGAAEERASDVKKYQQEQKAEKTKKVKPAKVKKQIYKKQEILHKPKAIEVEKVWEQQKAVARMREARNTFKTLPVDLSKMIAVKIDHRTTIFVKPGTDIELAKHNYHLQKLKQQAIKD